jgi:UPF0755 protein
MFKVIRLISKFLSGIVAFGLIVSAVFLAGAVYFNSPPNRNPVPNEEGMRLESPSSLFLEVRNGESAFSIGRRLKNAGVIRNHYFWYILFRLDGEQIKTGSYRIDIPASQVAIRSVLTKGASLLVKVTIPEGVTLKKTAKILEAEGICSGEEFLAAASSKEILDSYRITGPSMEGYLFPDTYLFPLAYPASKVVSFMATNFFLNLDKISPDISGSMSPDELNRRVIIASIVEREYRIPEEAGLMAGVFYNRLRIGMALQSCATVEYVITEIQGRPHPELLYNRDLEIRNPYNTYTRPGLPPGPISAPGVTAIKAALNPAASDYLYFRLTDPAIGRHYFSKTLDDHILAGALYVKGR